MYLLDATTDWMQTISSWGSLVIGIGTLILGIVTYFQNSRIKTLTDLVDELKIQTTEQQKQTAELQLQNSIIQNRFELELEIRKENLQPVFTLEGTAPGINRSVFAVMLRNKGQEARDVAIISHSQNITEVMVTKHAMAGGKLRIDFIFPVKKVDFKTVYAPTGDWDVTISFSDLKGRVFFQKIHSTKGITLVDAVLTSFKNE